MQALLRAARDWGWLLALALSALSVIALVIAIHATAVPVLDDPDRRIIAREPGVEYDVALFCNDPATKGSLGFSEDDSLRRQVTRGQEMITWVDSRSANPGAVHYWVGPDSKQHSELVEVTEKAAECMRKKAR